ncbi:hypothetical protein ACFVAR_16125 [Bacillus subtilis]
MSRKLRVVNTETGEDLSENYAETPKPRRSLPPATRKDDRSA